MEKTPTTTKEQDHQKMIDIHDLTIKDVDPETTITTTR
jgi:hypothetical protein